MLNRTLIVPRILPGEVAPCSIRGGLRRVPDVPGHYLPVVWDTAQTRECFGPNAVMADHEYELEFQKPAYVDRIQCWNGPSRTCSGQAVFRLSIGCPLLPGCDESRWAEADLGTADVDPWHIQKYSYLHELFFPPGTEQKRHREVDPDYFGPQSSGGEVRRTQGAGCLALRATSAQLKTEFEGRDERVIVIGDLSAVDFTDRPAKYDVATGHDDETALPATSPRPQSPEIQVVDKTCRNLLRLLPPQLIIDAAQRVKNAMFGKEGYVGIYWRWGKQKLRCQAKKKRPAICWTHPWDTANCTYKAAKDAGVKFIYLATDANIREVGPATEQCLVSRAP